MADERLGAADNAEALRESLNALSAEIGRRKRAGLPCDDLIQRHRQLSEQLRDVCRPQSATAGRLVRERIADLEADGVRESWDDLLERSDSISPAMSWEWMHAWYSHFGRNHSISIEVVKETGTNRWVGLLPIVRVCPWEVSWRFEGWLPCRHVAICGTRLGAEVDYTHPLIARDTDRAQIAELLVHSVEEAAMPFVANHWDWRNEAARLFVQRALEDGFTTISEPRAIAYHILPACFEEYVSQVPSQRRRSYIRSYTRRGWLEEGEFVLEIVQDPEGIISHFPLLQAFSEAKYGRFSIWRLAHYRAFIESCVRSSASKGWPVLWLLKHREEPVAASLGWLYKSACSITAMTHDVTKRDLAPGHVLLSHIIKQLIEHRVELLDMHTAEGYKTQYLALRRMRMDPLILLPRQGCGRTALAAALLISGARKLAREAALALVRRRVSKTSHRGDE